MSLKLRKLLHYNHIKNSISEFVPWVQARSLQSCPTLCDPIDYSPPGSSIHWILQARILEWFAMPSSRGSSRPRDWTCVSYVYLHWQAGSIPLAPPGKPLFPALFSIVFSVTKSYSSLLLHELQHGRFPVLQYLTELAQTHIYWVGDAIQPSHSLSPLLLLSIFPSIRGFSS